MAIKNYTTVVPANKSINEIQESLIKHGAQGILQEYERGTGRIASLKFILELNGKKVGFALPVQWQRFQAVLKQQGVRRQNDEDYVYRVAWRCIRDWVLAQMALYETEIVELPQIFLPFAEGKGNRTLYEIIQDSNLLLDSGK